MTAEDLTDAYMVDVFGPSAVSPQRLNDLSLGDAMYPVDPLLFILLFAGLFSRLNPLERIATRGYTDGEWLPLVAKEIDYRVANTPDGVALDVDKPGAPEAGPDGGSSGAGTALSQQEEQMYEEAKERIRSYVTRINQDLVDGALDVDEAEAQVDRVLRTETQMLANESIAADAVRSQGAKAKVKRVPESGACRYCRQLFLNSEGQPKTFLVSDLISYGTNAGRRPADWMPTLGPVHPNCRCSVEPVTT